MVCHFGPAWNPWRGCYARHVLFWRSSTPQQTQILYLSSKSFGRCESFLAKCVFSGALLTFLYSDLLMRNIWNITVVINWIIEYDTRSMFYKPSFHLWFPELVPPDRRCYNAIFVDGGGCSVGTLHPSRPPSSQECVCLHICVCFRKWCSTSLCKFIHNTAETKISSLQQANNHLMPTCHGCYVCIVYVVEHICALLIIFMMED